jgi:hypothetical protein
VTTFCMAIHQFFIFFLSLSIKLSIIPINGIPD